MTMALGQLGIKLGLTVVCSVFTSIQESLQEY